MMHLILGALRGMWDSTALAEKGLAEAQSFLPRASSPENRYLGLRCSESL